MCSISTVTATEASTESTWAKEQPRDQKRLENTCYRELLFTVRRTERIMAVSTTRKGIPENTEELAHVETSVALWASEHLHQLHRRPPLISAHQLPLNTSQLDLGFTKLGNFYLDLSWTFHMFREYYPYNTIPFPDYESKWNFRISLHLYYKQNLHFYETSIATKHHFQWFSLGASSAPIPVSN